MRLARPRSRTKDGRKRVHLSVNSRTDRVDRREPAQDPETPARRTVRAAWSRADRGLAGRRLGGTPGTRRGGRQAVPLPRLRPGTVPGHRARGGVADALRRGGAPALAHRVLGAAAQAPPTMRGGRPDV